MIKDILQTLVEDVGVAITKEIDDELNEVWNAYLVNFKKVLIEGVLVSSTGYGTINGEERKSSTLRHFLETVQGRTAVRIEPVVEDVFNLKNEYWISFYFENKLYDKQFVFEPQSIAVEKFDFIEVLGLDGILIK